MGIVLIQADITLLFPTGRAPRGPQLPKRSLYPPPPPRLHLSKGAEQKWPVAAFVSFPPKSASWPLTSPSSLSPPCCPEPHLSPVPPHTLPKEDPEVRMLSSEARAPHSSKAGVPSSPGAGPAPPH